MMAFQRHQNSAIKRINKMSESHVSALLCERARAHKVLAKRAIPPDSFFRERTLQRVSYHAAPSTL